MLQSTHLLMMCATLSTVTTLFFISPAVDATTGVHSLLTSLPATNPTATTVCDASMTEYDYEITRRILAPKTKYISYGALDKNTVPCSKRGASYYNCQAGAQANPYSRGCKAITRCRH
ncbi:hypothetical protein DCAR_0727869 [Daucus carota subsp. sativus]|uniref:Uncharacterized protein n=1 Tax=Daucus carota subsp. sativus TaxID=79200 RepID=A0A164TEY5_DAUCS|nr:hypothetical protein DCAR_0727869 [Daucus carota subsp. sativus]